MSISATIKKLNVIIKKMSKRMYNDILKNRKYKLQILKHRVIFNFGIKPFVHKKGELYNGVIFKWNKYGI